MNADKSLSIDKRRQTLAVIAGRIQHPRELYFLRKISEHIDVSVFTFRSQVNFDKQWLAGISLVVFEENPDTPGYMKGLEEKVQGFDALMGIQTTVLSSFQACRIADKTGRPFIVYSSEWDFKFYQSSRNILAIQSDIIRHARTFIVPLKEAGYALERKGANPTKIKNFQLASDQHKLRPSSRLRTKFRKYISIPEDETVILVQSPLHEPFTPQFAIEILRSWRNLDDENLPRLIYAGNGPLASDLKYRAYDLALGAQVMFLHQNPEPFLADLYNACDFSLHMTQQPGDYVPVLPYELIEQVATGVRPILIGTGIAQNLVEEVATMYTAKDPDAIAADLASKTKTTDRNALSNWAKEKYFDASQDEILDVIFEAIAGVDDLESTEQVDYDGLANTLQKGNYKPVLGEIDGILLSGKKFEPRVRARLLRLKGEALSMGGQLEAATSAYSQSLELDDLSPAAYTGLGYIAWQGHSNEESVAFFRRALTLSNNSNPEACLGMGLIHKRIGMHDEALFWLEKSLSSDQSDPSSALTALVQTCAECRDPEVAIDSIKRVIENMGETPQLMVTLGRLYIKNGELDIGNEILKVSLT